MTDINKELGEVVEVAMIQTINAYVDHDTERVTTIKEEAIAKIKALVVEEDIVLQAKYEQLQEDMLKWHDSDEGEYAMHFKDRGDELREQISIVRGD